MATSSSFQRLREKEVVSAVIHISEYLVNARYDATTEVPPDG